MNKFENKKKTKNKNPKPLFSFRPQRNSWVPWKPAFSPGVCSRILLRETGLHQAGESLDDRASQGNGTDVACSKQKSRENKGQESPRCVDSRQPGWLLSREAGGCPHIACQSTEQLTLSHSHGAEAAALKNLNFHHWRH